MRSPQPPNQMWDTHLLFASKTNITPGSATDAMQLDHTTPPSLSSELILNMFAKDNSCEANFKMSPNPHTSLKETEGKKQVLSDQSVQAMCYRIFRV